MNTAEKSGIFLFLAVFTLGNIWVHVGTVDSGNVASDIKTSINQHFGFNITLKVLDDHTNDNYIRFWENFNDMGYRV